MTYQELLERAVRDAIPHIVRQQHHGRHEQDRADAVAWLDFYKDILRSVLNKHPACTSYE